MTTGGRASHEHEREDEDEVDVTDEDVAPAVPTVEREGEYTDSDVGPDDTDPPTGSYVTRDVQQ